MSAAAAFLMAAAVATRPLPTMMHGGPALVAAFKAAYGEASQHRLADEAGNDYTLTPSALIRTAEGFFLVAAADNDAGCHACFAGIAVTAFANDHGHLGRVTGRIPVYAGGDGSDAPAGWRIDTRLMGEPALLIEGGWEGTGCRGHGVGVVELAAQPVVRLEYLALTRDQEDIGDAYGSEHIVGHVVPRHDDGGFVVRYSGWTKPGGHRRVPVDITVTYHLKGDRFVPDKTVDDLRC